MYCIHCGAQIRDEALFCTKCGKKVNRKDTSESVEENIKLNDNKPDTKGIDLEKAKAGLSDFAQVAKEKSGVVKEKAKVLGRDKIALIVAAVATAAFVFDTMKPNIPSAAVGLVGSITSMILIRHNMLKDIVKTWKGVILYMGFLLGFFPAYFIAAAVLVIELVFPIVPVGYKFLTERM